MTDGHAAGLLLSLRRPAEAERLLRDLLARDPDWAEGYSYLARCLMEAVPARLDEALEVARTGAAKRPFDPWALEVLGCALERLGHVEAAAEAFRNALWLSPADGFARAKLGQLALARNMPLAALNLARDGLASDPTNPQLLGLKADAELVLQNIEPAAEAVTLALRHHPDEPHLHYLSGRVHAARANRSPVPGCLPHFQESVRSYAEAVRLAPHVWGYQTAYEDAVARAGWAAAATGVSRPLPANLDEQLERIKQREDRLARREAEEWQAECEAAASRSEDELLASEPLPWAFEEQQSGEEYQTRWNRRLNRAYDIYIKVLLWGIAGFLAIAFLSSFLTR